MDVRTRPTAHLRAVTPTTILASRLRALRSRLGTRLDAEERDDLDTCVSLAGDLDSYLESSTSAASPALQDLQSATLIEDWEARYAGGQSEVPLEAEMLSGHVEGQLLGLLARLTGARRALEIGMFTGYASLAIAEALPEDGRVVACEVDPYVARFASEVFAKHAAGARIDVRVGPAKETLRALDEAGETFDLAFIDADKGGYVDHYDALVGTDGRPGLVRPGGLICVDNTLYQGEVYAEGVARSENGRAIAAFNARLADDPRVEQVVLPLRDGVTLARRRD